MKLIRHNQFLELIKDYVRRLNVGQLIVGICFIVLSGWCLYNVINIMIKYFEFETIISLHNEPPDMTDFPGVTLCAPSIFTPQRLAQLFPDSFGQMFNKYKNWKSEHYLDSSLEQDEDESEEALFKRSTLLRKYENKALKKFSALDVLGIYSVQASEILISCKFHPINIRNFQSKNHKYNSPGAKNCTDFKPIFESIYEGKKCFTFYSDMYDHLNRRKKQTDNDEDLTPIMKKDCNKMVFDLKPSIELTLKPLERNIWVSYVMDPILMTVHPPNIMQNRRDFLFVQVMQDSYYDMLFTKKTSYLLPPPYKTRCRNYMNDNNGQELPSILRTRDQCISICINEYSKKSNDCANYYSVLTQMMFIRKNHSHQKICDHTKQNYNEYVNARNWCEKQCPEECVKTIFEISGHVRNSGPKFCPKWFIFEGLYNELRKNFTNITNFRRQSKYSSLNYNYQSKSRIQKMPLLPVNKWKMRFNQSVMGVLNDLSQLEHDILYNLTFSSCRSYVTIRIAPKPSTIVKHHPAISFEGYLGTIGGHIGIWLGLSLYTIIRFVVHILYYLARKLFHYLYSKSY
ncbi:hypothetical protein RDWZM_009549 [Blomia tropicalis]|uniref:Uncharacterized protein n=1 Tax=Blomia tropicalis TaxID=40697 RepID=A0A9Q0M3S3_BLOTA|nr:hypothetical protein RDWZM_009549 [Blomia tropicalis]